jgi:hypothetical protein
LLVFIGFFVVFFLRKLIVERHRESEHQMSKPAEYRKRAEECVRLAQSVRTPEQRTMLLHIAETWLRLADDAAAVLTHEANGTALFANGTGTLN